MPLLNVIDDNGDRVRGAPGNVLAAMLFPSDEAARQRFLVAASLNGFRYWEEMAEYFPPLAGLSRELARACEERFHIDGGLRVAGSLKSGPGELIKAAMKQEAVYGQAAAQMLLFMLAHNAAFPGKASVRTACSVASRFGGKSDEWGRKVVWPVFRGVSHLWAAYVIRGAGNLLKAVDGENLEPFIADAEFFRTEAEKIPRHGYPEPLQPPGDLWRAPQMMLPAPTATIPVWTDRHAKLLSKARRRLDKPG